ncbi:hypothetical protein ACGF5F_12595 [Streptomyces sp. NPDC047821]|uniref:hypothetical protein n=1 Tax=Streptomyces sp. NPDC047821 TaxID=3365488 RepID=UPI00371C6F49
MVRLLTSPQARVLRWLLIGLLCSAGGALLVMGVTLLLPDDVVGSMSDGTYSGLVLAAALVLCVAVYVRTRRKTPRPPR